MGRLCNATTNNGSLIAGAGVSPEIKLLDLRQAATLHAHGWRLPRDYHNVIDSQYFLVPKSQESDACHPCIPCPSSVLKTSAQVLQHPHIKITPL